MELKRHTEGNKDRQGVEKEAKVVESAVWRLKIKDCENRQQVRECWYGNCGENYLHFGKKFSFISVLVTLGNLPDI